MGPKLTSPARRPSLLNTRIYGVGLSLRSRGQTTVAFVKAILYHYVVDGVCIIIVLFSLSSALASLARYIGFCLCTLGVGSSGRRLRLKVKRLLSSRTVSGFRLLPLHTKSIRPHPEPQEWRKSCFYFMSLSCS